MRNPLTRRREQQARQEMRECAQREQRERRILAALKALGPLSEGELANFLGVYWAASSLRGKLLDLAIEGLVVATKQEGGFVWSLPEDVATRPAANDAPVVAKKDTLDSFTPEGRLP